jgi:hypothetical protein
LPATSTLPNEPVEIEEPLTPLTTEPLIALLSALATNEPLIALLSALATNEPVIALLSALATNEPLIADLSLDFYLHMALINSCFKY